MLGKEKEKKSIEKSILQFEITQTVIALQNYLDYTLYQLTLQNYRAYAL